MPYDKSLDQELFREVCDFGDTRITIGVYSYNGGEKKIQLSRENRTATDEWRFAKLGRLTKTEMEAVLPLIQKALEAMES